MTREQAEQIAAVIGGAFDMRWDQLAAAGRCDARGGMEHKRVRSELMNGGFVEILTDFILLRANDPSAGNPVNYVPPP